MAAEASQTLIRKAATKTQAGSLSRKRNFGASFTDVLDVDRDAATNISLDAFFDNVQAFFQEASFVYYGNEEPTNKHIQIWVDTSATNQDNLG